MKWLVVVIFFISNNLYSQERVARVLKVTSSKKYALIKHLSSFNAEVGSLLNLESPSGKICPVKIAKQMNNNRVIINIKTCSFKNQIKRGDWLSRSSVIMDDTIEDIEDEMEKRTVKRKKETIKSHKNKNIYILYNMANQFVWEGTNTDGSDYELTEEMSSAIGFGFEYYNLSFKRQWGYAIGGEYEWKREVSSAIDLNGQDQALEPARVYTFYNFFLNATYLMGQNIFLYGGGILSLPGPADNLIDIGMGYGAQGGLGYIGDKLKLTLGYRFIGYSGTLTVSGGDIDATSSLSGLILTGGYTF